MSHFTQYFLLILFIGSYSLFAQNKKDSNGLKQGRWIYLGADKKASGYGAKVKVEEGNYINGRKTGEWIKYHPDGKTIKLKGQYKNNRPEGAYSRYYSNGVLREKGVVKHYYANGQVQLEYTKIDGKLSGKIKTYYKNGNVKSIQLVQGGKPGKMTKNNDPNKHNIEKVYQDEYPPKITNPKTKGVRFIPSGYNTIFNNNDEIWQDGDFKDGQLYDGKVYIYGSKGLLIKVKVFKEGKFHSFGQL